jgi:hypothetical protein
MIRKVVRLRCKHTMVIHPGQQKCMGGRKPSGTLAGASATALSDPMTTRSHTYWARPSVGECRGQVRAYPDDVAYAETSVDAVTCAEAFRGT